MKDIKLGSSLIGESHPCFIIAEAGVNHNGDINLAKILIDIAVDAGADAVKFQTFKTEKIVSESAEKAEYQKCKCTTEEKESQYQMLKKLELLESDFKELKDYAEKKNILFLSTPFDNESADFLDNIGVPLFKIASGEITNLPFLQYIAKKKKPVIISTGMATLGEIEEALDTLRKENLENIILLHCITSYPAKIKDTNLRVMETLRFSFKLPVGLSDHTLGINVSVAARALNACVIEKHFTLNKKLPGPDHKASLEPAEFKLLVEGIRDVEAALGNGIKKPTQEEEAIKNFARKKIIAEMDILKNTAITEEMVKIKRTGSGEGLPPKCINSILGRKTRFDIKANSPITWTMIE
jgi:N-acetylneuraminate synthase/N,N'-diacetyllegionaminate synthase